MKKTALLHYWLIGMRGGEMVFSQLCNLFPEANVFTHALLEAIEENASGKWDKTVMFRHAEKFSVARFQEQMKNFISIHGKIEF